MEEKSITIETNGRPQGLRTWIEIETNAIKNNLTLVKKIDPKALLMAVVKSNAYGFGLFDFSNHIADLGADWLGVDSVVEAVALRKNNIELPILVLGYTLPERLQEAVENNISVTISSFDGIENIINSNIGKIKVHVKVDTGLHRQGFLPSHIPELLEVLKNNTAKIGVEGLYTHLADAKRAEGDEYTRNQIRQFSDIQTLFTNAGLKPVTHVYASPALLRHADAHSFDMIRVGALLYGIWPSSDMKKNFEHKYSLQSAFSWKTIVGEIKKLPAGSEIGYGRSEKLTRDSVIAICPVGYWHGYPGNLSSVGQVKIGERIVKIIGRVSMDMITVDVTDCIEVGVHDIVTLIDNDPTSNISADNVAKQAGVSVHELLTRINARIERIYK